MMLYKVMQLQWNVITDCDLEWVAFQDEIWSRVQYYVIYLIFIVFGYLLKWVLLLSSNGYKLANITT